MKEAGGRAPALGYQADTTGSSPCPVLTYHPKEDIWRVPIVAQQTPDPQHPSLPAAQRRWGSGLAPQKGRVQKGLPILSKGSVLVCILQEVYVETMKHAINLSRKVPVSRNLEGARSGCGAVRWRNKSDPSEPERGGGWVEASQTAGHPRRVWQGQWVILEPVNHQRNLTSPRHPHGILS